MSQLYHIQLKASVSETYDLSDKTVHQLDLTEILPEDEMKDILKGRLQERGYEEKEPGIWSKQQEGGVEVNINLENMELSAHIKEEKELETEVAVRGSGYSRENARNEARNQLSHAQDSAKEKLDAEGQKLQRQLTKQLEEGEQERLREVNEILQEVYAESLKRRAGQLGEIMEIHESKEQGQYELTIHVTQ